MVAHFLPPDMHIPVEDDIAEGDKSAARWTFTGTQTGQLRNIPPPGKPVRVAGAGSP